MNAARREGNTSLKMCLLRLSIELVLNRPDPALLVAVQKAHSYCSFSTKGPLPPWTFVLPKTPRRPPGARGPKKPGRADPVPFVTGVLLVARLHARSQRTVPQDAACGTTLPTTAVRLSNDPLTTTLLPRLTSPNYVPRLLLSPLDELSGPRINCSSPFFSCTARLCDPRGCGRIGSRQLHFGMPDAKWRERPLIRQSARGFCIRSVGAGGASACPHCQRLARGNFVAPAPKPQGKQATWPCTTQSLVDSPML